MVKGNGDRRRQLAANQKEDKKTEALRKSSGTSHTPAEVRARIISDMKTRSIPDSQVFAWVSIEGDKKLCITHLRCGSCDVKRCRFSHLFGLSHLDGMEMVGECVGMDPLQKVDLKSIDVGGTLSYDRIIRTQVRSSSNLCFIAISNELCYDYQDPNVFLNYALKWKKEFNEEAPKPIEQDVGENQAGGKNTPNSAAPIQE